ncbi:hypothetical protein BDZ91DRAFT_793040 [Kalaharituber pfeilii]|nr:hypothetical protein BDZ91DRAFT_793040 [Kalaharituber pfeilii]
MEWRQFKGLPSRRGGTRTLEDLMNTKGTLGLHEAWSCAEAVEHEFQAQQASETAWTEWAQNISRGIAIQEGEIEQGNEVRRVISEDDIEDVIYVGGRATQTVRTPRRRKDTASRQQSARCASPTPARGQSIIQDDTLAFNEETGNLVEVDFEAYITAEGMARKRKRDGELVQDQLARETSETKDSEAEETEGTGVEEPGALAGANATQVLAWFSHGDTIENQKGAECRRWREVEDFLRAEGGQDRVNALRECESWWRKEKEGQRAREASTTNQRLKRVEESLASVVVRLGVATVEKKDAARRKEEEVKKKNRETEARREADRDHSKGKRPRMRRIKAERERVEKDAQEAAHHEKQRLELVQAARDAGTEAEMEHSRSVVAAHDIKKNEAAGEEEKRKAEEEVQEAADGEGWQVVGTIKNVQVHGNECTM